MGFRKPTLELSADTDLSLLRSFKQVSGMRDRLKASVQTEK